MNDIINKYKKLIDIQNETIKECIKVISILYDKLKK